jgi:TnpA family transposase
LRTDLETALARNNVNLNKVISHWPDMLRVAGSLVTNQVRAYDLLRMFGREGHPTPLGQAFAEYGRIAKTEHLLTRCSEPNSHSPHCQQNQDSCGQVGAAVRRYRRGDGMLWGW